MRQALELALESLLHAYHEDEAHPKTLEAITAIKEALAQPEQEPVALQYPQKDIDWQREQQIKAQASIPPQRKPLSDEEMKKIWYAMQNIMGWYSFQEIARAIEAAHGIKE
jgi:hypothetical protein